MITFAASPTGVRRVIALAVIAFALTTPTDAIAGVRESQGHRTAVVTVTAAPVEVRVRGADAFVAVKNRRRVRPGSTIRTGATGQAEIQYRDGSFTRMDHDTALVIRRLTDDAGDRHIDTRVASGRTFNRVARLSETESFTQSTKSATAGVVGTDFAADWAKATHTSIYTLVDGTIRLRVRGEREPRELTAGQRVVIIDGTVQPVETLTPEQLCADPWVCANR